jgi:hypothetical protein
MPASQSYANHKRYVFGYHGVLFLILTLNLAWSIREAARDPGVDSLMDVLVAVGLILLAWYARAFALTVQNRVIRLEERLRLAQLLPDDLRGRIDELGTGQLVALRFASDAEVPALVRRVLLENIRDQDTIKRAITVWRPDYLRV